MKACRGRITAPWIPSGVYSYTERPSSRTDSTTHTAQYKAGSMVPSVTSHHGPTSWARSHGRADTHTCVPGVAARCPGQLPGEGAEQVEESPGKDDDVVDVQVRLNDHRCHANAFGSKESQRNQHKQKKKSHMGSASHMCSYTELHISAS